MRTSIYIHVCVFLHYSVRIVPMSGHFVKDFLANVYFSNDNLCPSKNLQNQFLNIVLFWMLSN